MTKQERRLLLTVAKDLRRLWDVNPERFGWQFAQLADTVRQRREQYDRDIRAVEECQP